MSVPRSFPFKISSLRLNRPVLGAIRPISSFRPFPFPTLVWMPDEAYTATVSAAVMPFVTSPVTVASSSDAPSLNTLSVASEI